jgi:hypothetical protein
MKKLIILNLLLLFCFNAYSQILGGIMNEAKRKLERKIENKIIEAVSEELARRAFKPIDEAIDSMMRQKYQDSINGGKQVDWEKAGQSYAEFLAGMNKAVELPEKYTFDVTQDVEIVDYSNKTNYLRMHYSKNDAVFGIEDLEEKDSKQFIVMDISRDAMIMFTTDKKGKKTGQVIPSVMKLASGMAASVSKDVQGNELDIKIEKTGKKKKIAGFQSFEYKGSTKVEDFVMYVSADFPVNWQSNYTAYMSKFAPASYAENSSKIENGIMLQYENKRKDEDKVTTWTTVKVIEKSFDIKKVDYNFEVQ